MNMIGSILKGVRLQVVLQPLKICRPAASLRSSQFSGGLVMNPIFSFAKLSKKEKDKQKLDEEKKKVKEEIGDISTFDMNPFEEKYNELIESLKNSVSQYKIGRLDPSLFSGVYIKIGHNSLPLHQLAEVAPKSSNTCVLNPFDQDNL